MTKWEQFEKKHRLRFIHTIVVFPPSRYPEKERAKWAWHIRQEKWVNICNSYEICLTELFCTLGWLVKHENYPRKIPYISKKVRVWKIAYMKFTYTKFPTENILHIFWVWKIPYKKISYNNLEAYFCNWWTISPWKLTDVIWNWNKVGLVSIAPASIVNSKST